MDEFGIDLDKVLDEFEEREEENVSAADGLQRGQLSSELTSIGADESNLPPNFPAFEGLDLDLAEADFAPSHWNYEISSQENGRSDLKVVAPAAGKEAVSISAPDAEVLRNRSYLDDESAEAFRATNQILTGEVDVLSACLHTCVAEPELDVPGALHEQLENRIHDDVTTSPPDIVCSAPDVVSSAMVGVDVVPSSRTASDAVPKLNLNQEIKDSLEQVALTRTASSDHEASTLERLDVILKKGNAESEMNESADLREEEKSEFHDQLSGDTLVEDSQTKSLETGCAQQTYHSPAAAAAAEITRSFEDDQKNLGVDLYGASSSGVSDTAAATECSDFEKNHVEQITDSSIAIDKNHSTIASCPPEENEKCRDVEENIIASGFSPFPPLASSSCDTTTEVSASEVTSEPRMAILHEKVSEGSSLESSMVPDRKFQSAVYVEESEVLHAANVLESSRREVERENEEIFSAEMVIAGQANISSFDIHVDQSASFDLQAHVEVAVCKNSGSGESHTIQNENSVAGHVLRESEDPKEISERQDEIEVISDSDDDDYISEQQIERDVISSRDHSETMDIRRPGSVQQTEEVMKMSLEDEKSLEKLHKDVKKLVTEDKIERESFPIEKKETESRNELHGADSSKLFDKVAENNQSDDMLESADLSKEMGNRETVSCANEEAAKIAPKQTMFVGFGGAGSENVVTEEEIETYLRELDANPDEKGTDAQRAETHRKPDGDDDISCKEELLSAENVKFPRKKGGRMEKEEEDTTSNVVHDAVILDSTSEFNVGDKKTRSSDEFSQLDTLSSPSDSFMLINGHGGEIDGSSDIPVQFGNLADDQVESLMKEVEEEVRRMILDGETAADGDSDQTCSNSSDTGEADIVQSGFDTDKSHEESFENEAMFVFHGSEAKDGKVLKKVLNSEANQSYVRPAGIDLKDALLGEAVQSQAAEDTGLEADAGGPHHFSTEDVATSDHSLLLPVMKRFDHDEDNIPSSEDRPSPADVHETQQPENGSGARQKEMKPMKPQSLDLASSLNEPPATSAAASSEGNEANVEISDAQSMPPGILSPSLVSTPTIPLCSNISLEITQLGRVAPIWLPDAEASKCMECEVPFSFTRRRHHCRACGKVFCHGCSSLRATLQYLENKQDRVCSKCYQDLVRASFYERNQPAVSMRLNPNDSGSTISSPVQAQASSDPQQTYQQYQQSVSAPTGVLRKQGSIKGEAKQVMFSDGIRPGGDLTDLDGSSDVRPSTRRSRKADKSSPTTSSAAQIKSQPEAKRKSCLIPNSGLPPVLMNSASKRDLTLKDDIPAETILQRIRDDQDPFPVSFAINRDVVVLVKIINLDCCVNRLCWSFTTKGLCTVGQDEIVIILECLPDEKTVPLDILHHLHVVYEMASHGNTVNNLDHTVLPSGSLGSNEVGGFLYIRQTFQCLQKIILPDPPYLFGLLLQKWEMSWARVFPLRLMFRLGAEFRYYPSPLISVRSRKPVYGEIGHTIMNLLADFHNYQYMIPRINGLVIHMEDKRTTVSIPRNRYNMLMKILSNSDDHVIALGASFSSAADSHLVCLQNEDGNYQTQAINIQNRPRRVTGACFIVFNGALKPTSGLRAKSSIVEDGLMVQITSDAMTELKQVLSEMKDYKILCGSVEIAQPEEMVNIEWNNDEKHINAGVKSPIDGLSMYGVDSIRIHSSTDFAKDELTIRWTEVFVLRNGASQAASSDTPSEVSHLAESLAQACCQALVGHLSRLAFEMLNKIALRVTIDAEQVGYEIGSRGVRLPDFCMNDLDEKLIGIMHGAASPSRPGPIVLELIFHILHPYIAQSGHSAASSSSSTK